MGLIRMDENNKSSFSRKVSIQGSVIDEATLRGIDEVSKTALGEDQRDAALVKIACVASDSDGNVSKFDSLEELLNHYRRVRDRIHDLRIDYRSPQGRIEVFFDHDGEIDLTAYGPTRDFHFVSEAIVRELRNCDPGYNWLAKFLAFSKTPRRILGTLILPLSFFLLFQIYYYYSATQIGVNVDPGLLYEGNSYYQDVENAIKTDDLSTKLDTLLKGQLKGFTNVSEVLEDTQYTIGASAVSLVVVLVLILLLRSFSNAYPRSFFAIGLGIETLSKLERKREIWVAGVGIAFMVNLIAGFVVAFVS